MIRRGEIERGVALDIVRHQIAGRIRRVCEHFDEADFSKLVDRMAEIEVRYRMRDEWSFYRKPARQVSVH
jgi:IS1 family transposase